MGLKFYLYFNAKKDTSFKSAFFSFGNSDKNINNDNKVNADKVHEIRNNVNTNEDAKVNNMDVYYAFF